MAARTGEADTLVGDAVDVGGAVPHHPVREARQVGGALVVAGGVGGEVETAAASKRNDLACR